ncbi:MAG: ComEC/Rec2 family competence protein, partial [Bryobacteraceae bacterium]
DIHVLPDRCGSRALSSIFSLRTWALHQLRALYPGDAHTRALLSATLLGETAGVERSWTNAFRVTGTYHALVISGLHISIVAMALLFLLRVLWVPRLTALWAAVGVCWGYSLLAGFHAPAVRASAGFMLFVVAATMFRRARTLNLLAFIGIVYLVCDPSQLFDASFQLSFLSVALIAVFARPAMERFTVPVRTAVRRFDQLGYDPKVPPRAAQWRVELRLFAATLASWTRLPEAAARRTLVCLVILSTFAADLAILSACIQFGLALPMIAYFHRLSITGISANIVVVPLLSLVVPLGFAAIVTGWHWVAWAAKLLLQWAEIVAAWHVHFEPAWRIAALPLWIAILFALSLLVLALAIRRWRRCTIPALAGSLAVFAVICLQPWRPEMHPGMLEVSAIDVN